MIDVKNFKKGLVEEVELSFGVFPFVFTYGIISRYAKSKRISLNGLLALIGENVEELSSFSFFALKMGCEFKEVKNPLTSEEFEAFLSFEDATLLMEAFMKCLPQDEETEEDDETATAKNEVNQ